MNKLGVENHKILRNRYINKFNLIKQIIFWIHSKINIYRPIIMKKNNNTYKMHLITIHHKTQICARIRKKKWLKE